MIGPAQAKRLATVAPELAGAFLEISQDFARQFPRCYLGVAQGYRTPSDQLMASTKGLSNADGRTGFSYHQVFPSWALDYAVLDPTAVSTQGYVTDGSDARYLWVGQKFEHLGFRWGGHFVHVKPDWDHVEMPNRVPDAQEVQDSYERWSRTLDIAPYLRV